MSDTLLSTLGEPHLRLQLRSDPTYLSGARELVSSVSRRLGFSEEGCGQIALAVDEALCNIIRHGYDRRKDGLIWVSLWPLGPGAGSGPDGKGDAPGIAIVLEDEARQVDPEKIRSRDLDEIRPGGLGVHIIREVMDQVTYEKRPVAGMRLTLIKRVPPQRQAALSGTTGTTHAGASTPAASTKHG